MNHPDDPTRDPPPLRDPEVTSAPDPAEGVSSRKFLGIPAWAAAVGFAALAAVMYLLMLALAN